MKTVMMMLMIWLIAFGSSTVWARSISVTSRASFGDSTLRDAIDEAEDGDTIVVLCDSVFLTNQLEIVENRFPSHGITIEGNGVTLDGQDLCRILYVGNENKVVFRETNFENGHGPDLGQGGAIYNLGDISIFDTTIRNNGIYGGYTLWFDVTSGSGGAIYNAGKILIEGGVLRDNVTGNSGGMLFNAGGEVVLRNINSVGNRFESHSNDSHCNGWTAGCYGIYSEGGILQMEDVSFNGAQIPNASMSASIVYLHEMKRVSFLDCCFSNNCRSNNYPLVYVDAKDFEVNNCLATNNIQVAENPSGEAVKLNCQNAFVSNLVFTDNQGNFSLLSASNGTVRVERSVFANNMKNSFDDVVFLWGRNITIDDCRFEENNCGAMYCGWTSGYHGGCSNLLVCNSKFLSNHAKDSSAMVISTCEDVVISNCVFAENSSANTGGGAISGCDDVDIVDCVFSNNTSYSAGAVSVAGKSRFLRCEFVGNSATNGVGGAACGFAAVFDSCSFISNNASYYGGAIHSGSGRRFGISGTRTRGWYRNIVKNCMFLGNSALRGGAVNGGVWNYDPGTMICNSVFIKNMAIDKGSALCCYSEYYSAFNFLVANSTFVENDNEYLVYGSGVAIGNISVENGNFDYYYYVANRSGDDFLLASLFSVCSGKIDGVHPPKVIDVSYDQNLICDIECDSAGSPSRYVDSSSGFERIYYLPLLSGSIPGRGAFVWHDKEWDNIAYSMSKESKKHALVGDASNATICVDRDYLGREIEYPACPGAVYCPATSVIKHRVSFETFGGSEVASVDIENGMEVGQLPTPVRNGYWLYGWYADSNFKVAIDQGEQIVKDRTFYARWIPDVQPDGGPYPQIVDGIEWTYFVSNGVSYIKSSSSASAVANTTVGEVTVPSTLGGHTVCEIGKYAFYNCSRITVVRIPDCVTAIGEYAFRYCTELTDVTIPDGVEEIADGTFWGCNKLKNVKISKSVVQIGPSAFYGCYRLAELKLPVSVTNIGNSAFYSCSKLSNVVLPANILSIGKDAFLYCSQLYEVKFCGHLPDGIADSFLLFYATAVYYPEECADEYCSIVSEDVFAGYMREGAMPNGSYEEILGSYTWHFDIVDGNATIVQTNQLGEFVRAVAPEVSGDLVINDTLGGCSVVAIGNSAFWFCTELDSVVIPNGVAAIDDNAFYGCEMLGQVEFPSSLQSIGKYAFSDCGLSDVVIPDGVYCIGDYAFSVCEYLESVYLPKSVQSIGEGTFYDCTMLSQIEVDDENPVFYCVEDVLCDKVKKEVVCAAIGRRTFAIPTGMLNIRSGAFAANDFLEEIEIPASVTNVGVWAFRNCESLTTIRFAGALPAGLENSGLLEYATEVYYPQKYAEQYESVVAEELFAGYADEDVEDLNIVANELPDLMEMEQFDIQLDCSGGIGPYSWSASEEMYLTSTGACSYAEVGEAQGWYNDDGEWEYELPFEFNYCGRVYRSLVVNDNANLMFANGDDYDYVSTGFGDLYSENNEQDIFVDSAEDHVTFRWKRVRYSERTNHVNCAITLYSNGVIRCAFGDCFDTSREFSLWNPDSTAAYQSQECDDDIVFTPNYLPPGLTLNENGLISGAPTQAGHYEFDVSVEDTDGTVCAKRMSIDVAANPNLKPVVNSWEPCWGPSVKGGESATFAVEASDPENEALTYRWIWDDAEIDGATDAAYELVTDTSMRGWHTLRCVVSDGLWTITAHEWEVGISGEMYVSADDGADALQNALSASVDGDVIYVGAGTYSPIYNWSRQGVRIIATEGCENTFIDGAGSSACVDVSNYGTTNAMIRIEGFTIENGYGNYGGGVYGAWLIGCVVRNNESPGYGGGMCYGRADSCLFVGNSAECGGGTYYTELHNCTIADNVSTSSCGGSYGGNKYNTIIWGNTGTYDDSNVDDPLFADAENGDYSLSEGSPCIGMGENSDVATEYDLAGNARIQNGSVDLGAYESAYALPAPGDVSWLSADPRTYGILLDWARATCAKWYRVYRVEEALEDDAAELIATVLGTEYDDNSATFGVAYRYWVVPCNESSAGTASEYGVDELLAPLRIVDSILNSADVGSQYDYTLHATGGTESYTWSVPSYAAKIEDTSTFEEVGEAMGWTEDDASWFYELPFDFPVCGSSTNLVEVSDNGVLYIPVEDGWAAFSVALNLDLYANPGDIYITATNDAVTFRWKRVIWSTSDEVNVSATLYANGCVRLSCDGNSTLVDRGFEYGDNEYSYGVTGDIVLTPNLLPSGVEMDEDGLISGVPTKDGTYRFVVKAEDGNEECVSKEIVLKVDGTSSTPIPDIGEAPTSVEIYNALSGSADDELQDHITDGDNYNAYRNWAGTVKTPDGAAKAGAQTVRDAPTAWVSFALGSEKLLECAPTDEDLDVEEFEPSSEAGKFDFTVSVEGVEVGSAATTEAQKDAVKENLKQVFGLEGGTTLEKGGMSSANVDITFGTPENGKVKFTAGPKDTDAKTFFMKVKVK